MGKKLQLSLIIVIAGLLLQLPMDAFSQITVSSSDLLGLIGKTQFAETDTSGRITVDVGSAGANQTWDFQSLNLAPVPLTAAFLDPAETPFQEDFPQANFTWKLIFPEELEYSLYNYFEISSTTFATLGAAIDSPDSSFKQTDASDRAPLPLTYGAAWTSTEYDTLGDPQFFAFISTNTAVNQIDAWGTVRLPAGNFETLRIRSDNTTVIQVFFGGFEASRDTTENIDYVWMSKDNFIVAQASSLEGETDPNFTEAEDFLRLASTTTGIADNFQAPRSFTLYDNYPNPFNPETLIRYQLQQAVEMELAVFNAHGQLVRVLTNGVFQPGSYETRWDGTNTLGQRVSSGSYIYRLKAGNQISSKKMTLLQ